ncbi:MAG: hypothetical protein U1E26_03415 [Coriobacteriia bacterium]|nr:hypothetical protein [Coriobacteriia bacterium]
MRRLRIDEAAAALYLPALYHLGRRPYPRLVSELVASERFDPEQLHQLQLARLRALVTHCYANVPYYRALFNDLDVRPDDIRSMEDYARLPLLEKDTLRAEFASFIATDSHGERLMAATTSGSSGSPLKYRYDPEYFLHGWSALIRNMTWTGFRLGERQAWFTFSAAGGAKRALRLTLERKWLARELTFSDETLDGWARRLAHWEPRFVYGTPSSRLAPLAAHLLAHNVKPQGIRAVMSSSETLVDEQRQLIEEAFGAKVFNQYGATECLSIASECEAGSMHVNAELNLVEFERTEWTGDARAVIVTPLLNYGVPLLRYVLRDLGGSLPGQCPCGRTLPRMRNLIGRTSCCATLSDGSFVTPFAFEELVESTPGIVRFQFRQVKPDSFDLLVVTLPGAADSVRHALADLDAQFERNNGRKAHFALRLVDDIPFTPGGKHLYVIPLTDSASTSHRA